MTCTGQLSFEAAGKARPDHSYVVAVHDWQVIHRSFFGKKSHALLEARLCRRRKSGSGTLMEGEDILSQTREKKTVKGASPHTGDRE